MEGNKFNMSRLRAVLVAVLLVGVTGVLSQVRGSGLQSTYLRFSRMTASATPEVLVVFKVPTGNTGTEAKVKITFPAGYTIGATPGLSTTSVNTEQQTPTALPGTLTAAGSGQVITVSGVSNLSADTTYGFYLTSGVTNPSSSGLQLITVETLTSGDAVIDSTSVATRVIDDDQIVVSAVVPPTFEWNFTSTPANQDSFTANLDSTVTTNVTNGREVQAKTNAKNGWIGWVKSLNGALKSAAAGDYTIDSTGSADGTPESLSAGAEFYGLTATITTDSATSGSGTVSIAPEYVQGTPGDQAGTVTTSFSLLASADGPTDGDTINLKERATISPMTPAGNDYTDTLTVVGAGSY